MLQITWQRVDWLFSSQARSNFQGDTKTGVRLQIRLLVDVRKGEFELHLRQTCSCVLSFRSLTPLPVLVGNIRSDPWYTKVCLRQTRFVRPYANSAAGQSLNVDWTKRVLQDRRSFWGCNRIGENLPYYKKGFKMKTIDFKKAFRRYEIAGLLYSSFKQDFIKKAKTFVIELEASKNKMMERGY